MERFCELFTELDESNSTNRKVEALRRYFESAPASDCAWALYFLMGQKLKRRLKTSDLRVWVGELSELPLWLVEECYNTVGDLAETLALLLPEPNQNQRQSPPSLTRLVEGTLLPLADQDDASARETIEGTWMTLRASERFVFNKLLTGGFRVGVQRTLVSRALAQVYDIPPAVMAHRLMGNWNPSLEAWTQLAAPEQEGSINPTQPYPFYLAHPIENSGDLTPFLSLGNPEQWQVEWKWDGIRCQAIKRAGVISLWSRGEEIVTERFPEIAEALAQLPDGTVLDGEILAWKEERPLPFTSLQKRIGRKSPGSAILKQIPARLMAYDLLEWEGADWRLRPLAERRQELENLTLRHPNLLLSPKIKTSTWYQLAELQKSARERGVEGFMLKRRDSAYQVGRVKGDWWKWKVEPLTIDAVMIYAQSGHGRRAGLYTDYTFALWREDELVPIAKAYSGLSDKEFRELDRWIKSHTREKFGPVRSVDPEMVFEIGFEAVNRSPRHKSGFALRFPRMLRWRRDKPAAEADSISALEPWLPPEER